MDKYLKSAGNVGQKKPDSKEEKDKKKKIKEDNVAKAKELKKAKAESSDNKRPRGKAGLDTSLNDSFVGPSDGKIIKPNTEFKSKSAEEPKLPLTDESQEVEMMNEDEEDRLLNDEDLQGKAEPKLNLAGKSPTESPNASGRAVNLNKTISSTEWGTTKEASGANEEEEAMRLSLRDSREMNTHTQRRDSLDFDGMQNLFSSQELEQSRPTAEDANAILAVNINSSTTKKRPYHEKNKMQNVNEEIRKMQEARAKRDIDFPYKVGIFALGLYHEGKEEGLLTYVDKDLIGRCIDTGLESRKTSGLEVMTNNEIRVSAGMAVLNCKDKAGADWIIKVVKAGRLETLAKSAKTPFRDGLILSAEHIAQARLWRSYSAVNTNKADSWSNTMAWLRKSGVNTDGWILLNARVDRNQIFTFIDPVRTLDSVFEGMKDLPERKKAYVRLASNITIRWPLGEDETVSKPLVKQEQEEDLDAALTRAAADLDWD